MPLIVQNLIATKLGVQKITGITVFDTHEEKAYDPSLDLEVSYLYLAHLVSLQMLNTMLLETV